MNEKGVHADAYCDTEAMGCGDLMIALMKAMRRVQPGQVLEVRALDPGAPADIPSWHVCGPTGQHGRDRGQKVGSLTSGGATAAGRMGLISNRRRCTSIRETKSMTCKAFTLVGMLALFTANVLAVETHKSKPKQVTLDARHELKITVPEGTKRVRVWFAVPQDVPQQKVSQFKVESPFPYRIERDATEGNKLLYMEASDPAVKEFTIVTTFRITRQEVLNRLDPRKTRPLTEAERRQFAHFLATNRHVIIDDRIRQIAKEVVGDEQNPLRAARKIYDKEN